MTAPGWYHGNGDPQGTVRYWDGATWVGDAMVTSGTVQSAGGGPTIEFTAAPDSSFDLGDVAVRRTLAEQGAAAAAAGQVATAPGTSSSRSVLKRKRLPEGLKNLVVLVSAFKALPLAIGAMGFFDLLANRALNSSTTRRYTPPGVDFDTDLMTGAVMLGAMIALGGFLLVTQVRAATRNQPSVLFSFALILVVMDLANLANQWARFGGAGIPLAIAGITALQVGIAVWAYFAQRRYS